jgi:hypothetical protein
VKERRFWRTTGWPLLLLMMLMLPMMMVVALLLMVPQQHLARLQLTIQAQKQ